jgi:histidyl-tRNA synthetase
MNFSKNDLSFTDMKYFRIIEKAFLKRSTRFGYKEIKTSTIDSLYLFSMPDVLSNKKLKQIYSFLDWKGWDGERVTLKPDSSVSVARFFHDNFSKNQLKQKLCYVDNHFKFSGGSISERWQFGIENIGSNSPEDDLEIIIIAYDILKEIYSNEFYIFLSYPLIIKKMLKILPIKDENILNEIKNDLNKAIKKLAHITDGENLINLLQFQIKSVNYLKNVMCILENSKFKTVLPELDKFITICKLLDKSKCPYIIDFSNIGDLDYYTGIQFQMANTIRKDRRSILCSGGRYDNLVGNMLESAEAVPSTGFALYTKNIIKTMPDQIFDNRPNVICYIKDFTKQNVKTAQLLCEKFSQFGFNSQISFNRIDPHEYSKFIIILEVNTKFKCGYNVLYSKKIERHILSSLFENSKNFL